MSDGCEGQRSVSRTRNSRFNVLYTFNMSRITNTFTFGLCLASMFQTGLSLQLAEQESAFFDGISGDLPLTKCDMIVVSPTPLKGIGRVGRSSIYFTSLKLLYRTWNEQELAPHVAFMPCLIAFIKADSFGEAMNFVDRISGLKGNPVKSKKKYLVLNTPHIDQRLMQNITGNINVHIITEGETGDKPKITSICPALAKKYSMIRHGMCPPNFQNPRGKVIPISVIGVYPLVVYGEDKEWVGGTEFQVIDVYAKKFGFTPKLMRATGYDNEGSVVDMVNQKVCEIGVGQHSMIPYRYKLIEYLPHMFTYVLEVQSKKPEQIISFDALIYPLDSYSRYFTLTFTTAVLLLLILIQKCWTHASGQNPPNGWLFQDFVLALTPSVDETVPWIMYWRESFTGSRRLLLIQWLIMGNVISHVYKGALLSSLITIRYTEPLDTMIQMEQSGIPFYCLRNTITCWLAKTDPRDVGIKLNERRFDMPFSGGIEDKYLEEIDRGDAMLYTSHTFWASFKNRHHFSKEALASMHAAHIVVQGSPLLNLFHSTTYWLKASGIFDKLFDNYMNAEPYIPQPKENDNKPLVNVQLMMLWLIWVSGLTAGLFAFFGELMAEGISKHLKQIRWPRQKLDNGINPMIEMPMPDASSSHGNGKEYPEEVTSTIELE